MFYKILKYQTILKLKSGKGGDGGKFKKFHKNILKGGDGGKGGSIYIFFDKLLDNINYYFYNNKYFSKNGENGKILKNGKDGKNIILRLPYYNFIIMNFYNKILKITDNKNSKKFLKILVLSGGKGGVGCFNKNIKKINLGSSGKYSLYSLFLKTIFHFSFLGLPNSGKSTFFSNFLKFKRNKISVYSFTTQVFLITFFKFKNKKFIILDNLGFIKKNFFNFNEIFLYSEFKIFFQFINIFFIFFILKDFKISNFKIYKFSKKIFYKPRVLILNKIDLLKSIYKSIILDFNFKKIFNWSNLLFFNSFYFKKNYFKLFKNFFIYL